MAIKYNPWFGDAFYNSSKFGMAVYLLRVFTSWAIVAEVNYYFFEDYNFEISFRFIIYQKWFVVLKRIQLILLIVVNLRLHVLAVWLIVFGTVT